MERRPLFAASRAEQKEETKYVSQGDSRLVFVARTAGRAIRGFGDSLRFQVADTFQKSVLFVLALQMNSFLTELVDHGTTNLYRLGTFALFSVFSVGLMQLKDSIEQRDEETQRLNRAQQAGNANIDADRRSRRMLSLPAIASSLILAFAVANRFLLFVDTVERLRTERYNDAYVLVNMCDAVDYRRIGRHAVLCEEIEHRLRTSLYAQAAQRVVENTLYRRVSVDALVQMAALIAGVAALGAVQRLCAAAPGLPVQRRLKFD
ncbi:Hypothetical Protein FCC1311_086032 [Hondaea fermentalgiana]|uniref:Uncharacterized protein n=1 Tax=Hondaea fermentalgiana TaxID=2315210 RepID=A0A2R5GRI6_9STRA|nr:Hypothetical Protein FCC1311_086032 [Hondaea fermentalgiana]|eukprot:GBG32378.1 Hypothetical Protein FCC1311_086032 [Hondaea fermentalgiana]